MSARQDRLKKMRDSLKIDEAVAWRRVKNARRDVHNETNKLSPDEVSQGLKEARLELKAASKDLERVRKEISQISNELDAHLSRMPTGALILITDGMGGQSVSRCVSAGDDLWCDISDPDQLMTFEDTIGATGNYHGDDFARVYTQDEVDDILDREHVGLLP